MKFLFEITSDHLINYTGADVFRATIYYEVRHKVGIVDTNVVVPLDCIPYIKNNPQLASDIWSATLKHAEAVLEEDKEFDIPEPEYNDQEQQEKYLPK